MKFRVFVAAVALIAAAPAAHAQFEGEIAEPSQGPWDPNYEPPRLENGQPSFEGVWTNASLTVLERATRNFALLGMNPDEVGLVLPDEKAAQIAKQVEMMRASGNRPTDPNEGVPQAGGDPGGYNTFWMDFGTGLARIDGQFRTSWIVDPEDGKLPWSEEGRQRMEERRAVIQQPDNPETRTAGERCTVGFGSTGVPPMLNVLYNNHYEFAQDDDVVAIVVEMNHQARMIRLNDEHRPPEMRQWLGDSIGEWEGDTLVVHTTNGHPQNVYRGAIRHQIMVSPDAEVTERFTRVSDNEIFYEWTLVDPVHYTQPVKGEMVFLKAEGPIFEYACHEGNYSMPGILAGARREERLAAEAE